MSSANSSHRSDTASLRSPAALCNRSLVLCPDPGTRTIAIPAPMRAPHTRPAKKLKKCTSSLYSIVATSSRSSSVSGSPLGRGRRGTARRFALDPSADGDTTATKDGSPRPRDTSPIGLRSCGTREGPRQARRPHRLSPRAHVHGSAFPYREVARPFMDVFSYIVRHGVRSSRLWFGTVPSAEPPWCGST